MTRHVTFNRTKIDWKYQCEIFGFSNIVKWVKKSNSIKLNFRTKNGGFRIVCYGCSSWLNRSYELPLLYAWIYSFKNAMVVVETWSNVLVPPWANWDNKWALFYCTQCSVCFLHLRLTIYENITQFITWLHTWITVIEINRKSLIQHFNTFSGQKFIKIKTKANGVNRQVIIQK